MKKKILIVDKHLVNKDSDYYNDLINIFPMKYNDKAYRTSLEQLKKRSELQSNFYNAIYQKLLKVFLKNNLYTNEEFKIIFNQIFVKFTNIFIDHYIRIEHRIRQKNNNYFVLEVEEINTNDSHTLFLTFVSNWQINQYLTMKICNVMDIENKKILNFNQYPELNVNNEKIKNVLFAPYGSYFTNLGRRSTTLKIIFSKFFGRLINKNKKILSAGFSSDEYYFGKSGAYGPLGFFYRISGKYPNIIKTDKNINKREKIKKDIIIEIEKEFLNFIKEINNDIDYDKSKKIFNLWANLIINWMPSFLFENYNVNLNNYATFLKKNNFNNYLIGESSTLIDNERGLLLSLSAKKLKGKLLGIQHSAGHFGYIDDLSFGNYFEFNHYDEYFTFGWDQTNNYLPKSNFVCMPCPKLSSFSLKSNFIGNKNDFYNRKDILFLSNVISRFPMGGTCGHSRIDFLDEILKNQTEMISSIVKNNISILHKPYNRRITLLFSDHFKNLNKINNQLYSLLNINQKGLTIDLIKNGKILLWDQIGSGTVEAFANNIPSMIYWNRIYSKEADWAKKNIEELENYGVLHDSIDSLIKEIKIYIKNPEDWINYDKRINAIKSFSICYANYNINWYNYWKNKINNLTNDGY